MASHRSPRGPPVALGPLDPRDLQVISRTLSAANGGESGKVADSPLNFSGSELSSEGSRLIYSVPDGISIPAGPCSCEGAVYDRAVLTGADGHARVTALLSEGGPKDPEHQQLRCQGQAPLDALAWAAGDASSACSEKSCLTANSHLSPSERMQAEQDREARLTAEINRQAAHAQAVDSWGYDKTVPDIESQTSGEGEVIDRAEWQRQLAACVGDMGYDSLGYLAASDEKVPDALFDRVLQNEVKGMNSVVQEVVTP